MKSRLVASAALSAVVLLGATGCTFITPQATTNEYPASDGVNLPDTGAPVDVRNAFIVADEDGSVGNLVAGLVNTSDKKATLTITIEGLEPLTVDLAGSEAASLGADEEPLRIDGLDVLPGATVEVHFQSGDSAGTKIEVPVLDGTLPYYKDLVPEPAKPTPTPTATDTAAPAPED